MFGEGSGFVVRRMQLVPVSDSHPPTELRWLAGQRQEIGATPTSTYPMVVAEKLGAPGEPVHRVYQTDYLAAWNRSGSTPA